MSLRTYNTELGNLIDKIIKVYVEDNKFFVGHLKGVSEDSNLILINAKNQKNQSFPTIMIQSAYYKYLSLEEDPFPMKALADRISKIFPKGHVDYIPEQNIINILSGKIIVNEDGVKGSGPSAERIRTVYKQFILDIENPTPD